MARYSKLEVIQTMLDTGIVPVNYQDNPEDAMGVLKACYLGGVRVFEFTNRGDFAHEIFGKLRAFVAEECPDMILGAGSVIDAPTATLYMQLGADFIVGPYFNIEVSRVCNRRLIPYIPGCGSVTEIGNAQESGCDVCKVFPAGNVGDLSFVKNVKAPLPWSRLMVTGGVEPTEESITAWIRAGASCIGLGSKLFPDKYIKAQAWNEISDLCRKALEAVQNARKLK